MDQSHSQAQAQSPPPVNPPAYQASQGYYAPQQPQSQMSPEEQARKQQSPGPQQQQQQYTQQPPMMPYGVPITALGSYPSPIICPNCGARGTTDVGYESGGFTHLVALVLCFATCCLGPLAYIPTSFKDAHHRCSSVSFTMSFLSIPAELSFHKDWGVVTNLLKKLG